MPAVAYASIGRGLPGRLRARMMAVLSTAWVVPGLAGPALAQEPTPAEREKLTATLSESVKGIADPKERSAARRGAVEDLYWAVLTSREFLFNH